MTTAAGTMVVIMRGFCFDAIILLNSVFIKQVSTYLTEDSKRSQCVAHYQYGYPSVWKICTIMPLVSQMLSLALDNV